MSVGQGATGTQSGQGAQQGQAPADQQGSTAQGAQGATGQQDGAQGSTWRDGEPFDPVRAMATIDRLRGFETQAQQYQRQLQETQTRLQEMERGQMTDSQRIQSERDEAVKRAEAAEQALADRDVQGAVSEVAGTLRFHDPSIAHRLIDAGKIDKDRDGKPKRDSIETALKAELAARPWLAAPADADAGAGRGRRGGQGGSASAGTDMNARLRRDTGRA